jgi:transcriptional regulator with XRE-family HTH domain
METSFLWKTVDNLGYNCDVPSARDPEAIYRLFGRRLRELRESRHLPQQELATLSGLTRASIANIESGRQRVLLHQILQFAEALRVDLDALVPRISEPAQLNDLGTHTSMVNYLQRLRGLSVGIIGEEQISEWKTD